MNVYKDITTLRINSKVEKTLKENNINNIFDLCHYSRMELAEIGIKNDDINNIMVKLQLIGLNLKTNHAVRNNLVDNINNGT